MNSKLSPKPFSQACENNYRFILPYITTAFTDCSTVLEIGSGTGQHAYHFAQTLPHVSWQTSDLAMNHEGIKQWISGVNNIKPPLLLDVNQPQWPALNIEGAFTANTLHIMSWPEVEKLFRHVGGLLKSGNKWLVYGPFNINGQFTSDSNAAFDQQLKAGAEHRGIRDLEAVEKFALSCGLTMAEPTVMPANNFLLTFTQQ